MAQNGTSDDGTAGEGALGPRFAVTKWRQGYDRDEVDAFLAAVDAGTVTEQQVAAVRFRPTMARPGYDEDEVDRALDEIAARLRDAARTGTGQGQRPRAVTSSAERPVPYATPTGSWTRTAMWAGALLLAVLAVVVVLDAA